MIKWPKWKKSNIQEAWCIKNYKLDKIKIFKLHITLVKKMINDLNQKILVCKGEIPKRMRRLKKYPNTHH